MIPFSEFEKTPRGDTPYHLSASHPDGKYLAMQAGPGQSGSCASDDFTST